MTESERALALSHYTELAAEAEAEAVREATDAIMAEIRAREADLRAALAEATARLEHPRFTAAQVEAASKGVEASWNTGYRSFFFLAHAALSAIGTVEGEG